MTGGASGLGKATVERFVKQGFKVVLCDLPVSKGSEVAKEFGENVVFTPADVIDHFLHFIQCLQIHFNIFQFIQICSEEEITSVLNVTKEKFGRLDNLVNCAGVAMAFQTYNFTKKKPHKLEDFAEILNVMRSFRFTRFYLFI